MADFILDTKKTREMDVGKWGYPVWPFSSTIVMDLRHPLEDVLVSSVSPSNQTNSVTKACKQPEDFTFI